VESWESIGFEFGGFPCGVSLTSLYNIRSLGV